MYSRVIAYATYKRFAQKYNIDLKHKDGTLKTMRELAQEIYKHEMKNINKLKFGLYIINNKRWFTFPPIGGIANHHVLFSSLHDLG